MQQVVALGNISHMACIATHAVDQTRPDQTRIGIGIGIGIGADVSLHPEVPLVALLAFMHLGVSGLVVVSGEGGCSDQGGIDRGTGLYAQHKNRLMVEVRKQTP